MKGAAILVAAVVFGVGCGGQEGGGAGGDGGAEGAQNATMQATLGGGLYGKYVRIRGDRAVPADPAYPCTSSFDVCVQIGSSGWTEPIRNLCPSMDIPAASWSFRYALFTDSECTNEMANLSCVPREDEPLAPGSNHNSVECRSGSADKEHGSFCVVDPMTGAGRENCPEEMRRILVLEPTVANTPEGGWPNRTLSAIEALGFIPVLKSAAEWGAMTTADFGAYRAIVLADPLNEAGDNCGGDPGVYAAAEANVEVWGPAVDGNVLFVGTDPTFHGPDKVLRSFVRFATWEPYRTGLYIAIGCTMYNAPAPVPLFSYFGDFTLRNAAYDAVEIVGSAEALADLTINDLSGWDSSIHALFVTIDAPPGEFRPFAVATEEAGDLAGTPYIIGRGLDGP